MDIQEIQADEFEMVWPLFHEVIASGDTYPYDPAMPVEEARALWTTPPARAFVARDGGELVGCYMLKPNLPGLGSHVANCGYMIAPAARGRGLGGALCEHSLVTARAAGFLAMQFNAVVASNEAALHLWQQHGFAIIGRVPEGFRHAQRGLTDILIMHRFL